MTDLSVDCRPSILEANGIRIGFHTDAGQLTVVIDLSICIPSGKTVALVGESGCGKSATALAIMRLIPPRVGRVDGQILFTYPGNSKNQSGSTESIAAKPVDLLELGEDDMRRIRGNRIAMIFQDPFLSLHPLFTVGEQIVEAIELHQGLRKKAAWHAAVSILNRVGIADAARRAKQYPHQFSGGMRQRAMIAMALACKPAMLIADEPTTALDVTVQAQILDLLVDLQGEFGMSILLITHDLGVVSRIADHVYVMYAGRIVEHAPTMELLANPRHPYTQGLIDCMPSLVHPRGEPLKTIAGNVPDPARFPSGCRFHPRCGLSAERSMDLSRLTISMNAQSTDRVLRRCAEEYDAEPSGSPILRELSPGHFVACWEA